ncbi:MAG: rhodanese-like domain-containing protein [Alphaproteobacteria bacterium]
MNMKTIPALLLTVILVSWTAQPVRAEEAPETVPGAVTVDAAKAKELFDKGAAFIDPRKDADWDAGRIPGAHHLELDKVLTKDSLAKAAKPDDPVVFYCNGAKCMVSPKAIAQAVEWGWKKIYFFRTGFPAWKAAGYPTE